MDHELEKQDEGWAKSFRDACHAEAERPQSFWAAQRAQVRERVAARERRFSLRFALASVAVLFVVAGALLSADHAPASKPDVTAVHVSDQQLLADIDETLTNPMPDALAPVDLLAQDLDRSLKASGKKETR